MEHDDSKSLSRREFLTWAAATAALLLLPGCEPDHASAPVEPERRYRSPSTSSAYASTTPSYYVIVPDPPPSIIMGAPAAAPTYATTYAPTPPAYVAPAAARQPQRVVPAQYVPTSRANVSAVSRNSWGAAPAIPGKMKVMNGVSRVTIHHEGSAKPNNDAAPAQVAATLRLIQSQHRKRMGAGDIGYHFIIDRTGIIWQGRDWAFQGAHTSGANAHNIGVMLLGNFEIQQPSVQQLQSLNNLTASLVRKYGLNPQRDIFGHCDFVNTQCPGRNLKPHVAGLKNSLRA